MDDYEQVRGLVDRGRELPDGRARVQVFEQAAKIAENLELHIEYEVKDMLRHAYYWAGDGDKMLVTSSWCLGVHDEHPDEYDPWSALDILGSALTYVASLDTISRPQINQLLNDLDHRVSRANVSRRFALRHHCFNAFWMGDHDHARQLYDQMWEFPFDEMCDTRPWRQVFRVDFFVHTGQYGRAVEVLDDAEIADGNDDDEFARWMNSFALHALIDQGEWATAEELHESTYYKLKNNSKYMELVAKHVDYLTARGDLEAAVSLFARHFLWLAGASTNRQVFEFQLSGLLLTEALLAQAVDRLQLAAPPELELPADVRAGELAPLHAWLGAQTAHWAKRFNDRNGNDYFDRIVAERRRLVLERG